MAMGGGQGDPLRNLQFGFGGDNDGQNNQFQGLFNGEGGNPGGFTQPQPQVQPQVNVNPHIHLTPPEDSGIVQQNLLIINEQLRNRLRDHAKAIGTCDGSNKANLKVWMKGISRAKKYCDASDSQIIDLIGTLATGSLAEVIVDYLERTDELSQSWEGVQLEINRAYLSEEEQQMQRNAIKELYQKPYEDVQAYGRNFKIKVSQAYPENGLTNIFVQESLIAQYISGIRDEKIKYETFSKRPRTLRQAIKVADAVEHTLKMVASGSNNSEGRVEEPMEINALATPHKTDTEDMKKVLNDMKAVKGQFEHQARSIKEEIETHINGMRIERGSQRSNIPGPMPTQHASPSYCPPAVAQPSYSPTFFQPTQPQAFHQPVQPMPYTTDPFVRDMMGALMSMAFQGVDRGGNRRSNQGSGNNQTEQRGGYSNSGNVPYGQLGGNGQNSYPSQGRGMGSQQYNGNRGQSRPKGGCYYCKQPGHFKRECPALARETGLSKSDSPAVAAILAEVEAWQQAKGQPQPSGYGQSNNQDQAYYSFNNSGTQGINGQYQGN